MPFRLLLHIYHEMSLFSQIDALLFCLKITRNNLLVTRGFSRNSEKMLYVFDLQSGEQLHMLTGHDYIISIIVLNQAHTIAATATSDKLLIEGKGAKCARVWDLVNGKQISMCGNVSQKEGSVYSMLTLCKQENRQYLLTSCSDGRPLIYVWYLGTCTHPLQIGITLHVLTGHSDTVIYSHMANQGRFLLSASVDNTVILWNLDNVYANCEKRLKKGINQLHRQAQEEPTAPNSYGDGMMDTTSMTINQ